jgi:hypothetical protein
LFPTYIDLLQKAPFITGEDTRTLACIFWSREVCGMYSCSVYLLLFNYNRYIFISYKIKNKYVITSKFNYKLDLEEMKQNLTVPVKTTSAYKNSKRSATDDRTSSIMIGWIGGFITCIPIILIISADIMKLFRNRQNKVNKLL